MWHNYCRFLALMNLSPSINTRHMYSVTYLGLFLFRVIYLTQYLFVYRLRQIFEVEHCSHSKFPGVSLFTCNLFRKNVIAKLGTRIFGALTYVLWVYDTTIIKKEINSKGMLAALFSKYYLTGILIWYEKDVTTDRQTDSQELLFYDKYYTS